MKDYKRKTEVKMKWFKACTRENEREKKSRKELRNI